MSPISLAHVGLWVHDQDEALAFYTEKLGFELRADVTLEDFSYRWLTVGPPGQPDVAFILNVPGPPLFSDDVAASVVADVATGQAPGFILHTDDCRATVEELRARGVEFTQEPEERPWGIDASFRDPSGNEARIVQPLHAA